MRRMIVLGLVVALALPTFALATTPQPAHAQGQTVHVVKLGETMYGIAGLYGTSVQAIANANGIVNPNYIYAGQRLVIPGSWSPPHPGPGPKPPPAGCGTYYRVQYGDTMTAIAVRHGTSVQAIANANGIPYPYNWIYAGQSLYIPCPGGPKPPHKPPPGHKPPPKATRAPALHPAACPREVQIVEPKERQHVSGTMMIVGTASIENQQFYKLEYAVGHAALESAYKSIGEVRYGKALDTVLGTWYLGNMPAGPYTLRLTAVDNRGQYPRPCDVHIFVNQ